jgi:uncharacterized iron-regulated membrane protein
VRSIVVSVLLVAVVILGMTWRAWFGINAVAYLRSTVRVTYWQVDAAYYSCLASEVQSVVPPGDTVWVSNTTPRTPSYFRTLWKVTAAYRPITLDDDGVVSLSLVSVPLDRACLGAQVKAVFPDGVVKYGLASIPSGDVAEWESLTNPGIP